MTYPPPFPMVEVTGKERSRTDVMGICDLQPFHICDSPDEVMMEVTMGHSMPHTHAETLLMDWNTMFKEIPRHERFAVRDIAQVPVIDLAGEVAIVDIPHIEPGHDIELADLQEAGKHIRKDDMVFIRTGCFEKHPEWLLGDAFHMNMPGITREAAKWLVHEKNIRLLGTDAILESFGIAKEYGFITHEVFYHNGVTMIDNLTNLSQIKSERPFVMMGLSMKVSGGDDSPARVIAFDGDFEKKRIVDCFLKMEPSVLPHRPPPMFEREEPTELREDFMKLCMFHKSQLSGGHPWGVDRFLGREADPRGVGMRDWASFTTFSTHLGTHMETAYMDVSGHGVPSQILKSPSEIPSERLCGSASVINLTKIGCKQTITRKDLDEEGGDVKDEDIAIVRTDFCDKFYHRSGFLELSPGFDVEAMEWFVDRKVKILVTDTATVERPGTGGESRKDCHYVLFKHDIPIVKCASNLRWVRQSRLFVYCSPMPLKGLDASPTRVMGVETYT